MLVGEPDFCSRRLFGLRWNPERKESIGQAKDLQQSNYAGTNEDDVPEPLNRFCSESIRPMRFNPASCAKLIMCFD